MLPPQAGQAFQETQAPKCQAFQETQALTFLELQVQCLSFLKLLGQCFPKTLRFKPVIPENTGSLICYRTIGGREGW